MPTLRFYFDYISPYAYLAWPRVQRIASEHGCELQPVPILFAALLNAHGQLGPAEIPAKRRYVIQNLLRLADELQTPFKLPPAHPFNPLLPLRLTIAGESSPAIISALFSAVWAEGSAIDDATGAGAALSAAGLEHNRLLALAGDPKIKYRLRENTKQAIAAGVFGVPTVVIDDQLFWGVDSLNHVSAYLNGHNPVDGSVVNAWEQLPAAASRRH